MLVIFPFEEPFYRERGVDAAFVGHPLAELPLPTITREAFAAANNLNPTRQWIALLPGSRSKEIRLNLPEMLRAAERLIQRAQANNTPAPEFVLPLAPTLTPQQRNEAQALAAQTTARLQLVNDARAALFHARASIVASGTATVEAALIGNPFVVVYRVSPITYAIAQQVVTVPHVAMANLIWDWNPTNRLVPELIQDDFQAEIIVQHLEPLLTDGPARAGMIANLAQVGAKLQSPAGKTAIGAVADAVLEQTTP
jgi:lipid-A-disaccharide synthase